MIVSEDIVELFIYPVTCISVFSNIALIIIILRTYIPHVGNYRYLLLSFAVVDILIAIVHCVLVQAIEMTEFGFIFWGFRFMESSTEVGITANLIFIALFYQTFVLLAFHYVYRYVLICKPPWLDWIGRTNPWRNWLSIAVVIDVLYIGGFIFAIYCASLPSDSTREAFGPGLKDSYGINLCSPNRPGYIGLAYRLRQPDGSLEWVFRSLAAISVVLFLFFGSGLVMVFCIWKVRKELMKSVDSLSARTRHLQQQLFRALLIQTLVPTVTSYIPLGSNFIVPLTGLSLGGFGTIIMMSSALFPLIDPFLVLCLISGYRSKLPFFVRNILASTVEPSATQIKIVEPKKKNAY